MYRHIYGSNPAQVGTSIFGNAVYAADAVASRSIGPVYVSPEGYSGCGGCGDADPGVARPIVVRADVPPVPVQTSRVLRPIPGTIVHQQVGMPAGRPHAYRADMPPKPVRTYAQQWQGGVFWAHDGIFGAGPDGL